MSPLRASRRTTSRRSGEAAPEPAATAAPAPPPASESVLSLDKVMTFVSRFVAPATLLTALLFYFGYVSSRALFLYFGVDVDILSLSNQQFVMRSPGALFVPVLIMLLLGAGLIVVHRLLLRRMRRMTTGRQRAIIRGFGWTGVVVLAGGLVLDFLFGVLGDWDYYSFATPMLLAVGAGLTAYAISLSRTMSGSKEGKPAIVLLVAAVIAGTFWATGTVAQWWGVGQARFLAADLKALPAIVVDTKQRLFPSGETVQEVRLPTDGATAEQAANMFQYRYHGLRVLVRGSDHLFLVPEVWSANASTYVIPIDDAQFRVRFRFFPDADTPR